MSVGRIVPGHGLRSEGALHDINGRRVNPTGTSGDGRARCQCGVLSEWLTSAARRKAWNREHKQNVTIH